MIYRAVNGRCLVDISQFTLPISDADALSILEKKGFGYFLRPPIGMAKLSRETIGKPYRRGARLSEAPNLFDCSSLTKWLYGLVGVWLPRRAIQQRQYGELVSIADIEEGDLVFTSGWIDRYIDDPQDGVGHVGIATNDRTIVHAANKRTGVIESPVDTFVKDGSFRGAKRIAHLSRSWVLSLPEGREIETSDDIRWVILENSPHLAKP